MLKLYDSAIESYCISKSSGASSLCDTIERFTKEHVDMSQMLIGKLEASLLGFLIHAIGAKTILEVGTFTGYSALAMASQLPKDGRLVTLDRSRERIQIAQKFWAKSKHGHKIKPILGQAGATLSNMDDSFDLIFIDADKENCLSYLKKGLHLLSSRGVLVVDNCLWSGKVLEKEGLDDETQGLKALTDYVLHRKDLYSVLLPIRDGILLVRPT